MYVSVCMCVSVCVSVSLGFCVFVSVCVREKERGTVCVFLYVDEINDLSARVLTHTHRFQAKK